MRTSPSLESAHASSADATPSWSSASLGQEHLRLDRVGRLGQHHRQLSDATALAQGCSQSRAVGTVSAGDGLCDPARGVKSHLLRGGAERREERRQRLLVRRLGPSRVHARGGKARRRMPAERTKRQAGTGIPTFGVSEGG
eukprot:5497447-Prymnesium_polylepis.2